MSPVCGSLGPEIKILHSTAFQNSGGAGQKHTEKRTLQLIDSIGKDASRVKTQQNITKSRHLPSLTILALFWPDPEICNNACTFNNSKD